MGNLKPKKKVSLDEKLKAMDKMADDINAKAGKKIMGRLGRQKDIDEGILDKMRIKFIPTPSRNFNAATGGGFPRGLMTIIAGLPDSGKTSLVLETIGMNMKRDPDFTVAWLESEDSLEEFYVTNTMGIDPNRFFLLEQRREDAGEAALDRLEAAVASGYHDMIVVNSLKAIVPSEEFKKSLTENSVALQARMNSKMVRKFISPVSESDAAYIVVTHLSTEIGGYGDPLHIAGGKAILYASSLIVDLRKKTVTDEDPIKKDEGIKIGVTVRKNHCAPHRNPYVKTDYYAIFGEGIEQYMTTLDAAVEQGVLTKAGMYIKDLDKDGNIRTLSDGTKLQFQGKKKFREFCIENPDYFRDLQLRIDGEAETLSEDEIKELEAEEEAIAEAEAQEAKAREEEVS